MISHLILAGVAFLGMFIFFLVLSKTLNNIINQLMKLEYLLQKELELQKETLTIKRIMDENKKSETAPKVTD